MHIILDANIYSADYRMSGVAFQSLFEYMRRTESRLVLPRITREEVVIGYGRQLKRESKAFEEAWKRYHRVDLSGESRFTKPDIKDAMTRLRRKLMKPVDGVTPIYVPEITGAFLQEAFMRGIHRTRPANEEGEELRDVILWLWTMDYANSVDAVTFISNDGGFWGNDEVHPDIDRDIRTKNGKLLIHRTIPEFLKAHAPAPEPMTGEWFRAHFEIQRIQGELIDGALKELRGGLPRYTFHSLSIVEHALRAGQVYAVSDDSQFAELRLHLVLKFVALSEPLRTPFQPESPMRFSLGGMLTTSALMPGAFMPAALSPSTFGPGGFGGYPVLGRPLAQTETVSRDLRCNAEAQVSVRIQNSQTTEVSVDKFEIDRRQLIADFYNTKEQD